MLASATAGVISRSLCHPLDTCKARLQNPGSEFTSTFQVVRQTLRHEGIGGLYRGLGTVISIGTPAFVLYLATYEQAKKTFLGMSALQGDYEFVGHFGAGMAAETVSCLVYVPVDVVKERLQVQRRLRSGQEISGTLPMYRGTWHALSTIMQTEGLRGVYRGYGATLLSFGPFSAFYFLFYEKFKQWSATSGGVTKQEDVPFHLTLASAAGAGALASLITNPVDLVRLRLQVQRGSSSPSSSSSFPSSSSFIPSSSAAATSTKVAEATLSSIHGDHSHPRPPPLPPSVAGVGGGEATAAAAKKVVVEQYHNTLDGLMKVYRREGFHGWFKGSGARIAFYTPSTMISMSLYDTLKSEFHHLLS